MLWLTLGSGHRHGHGNYGHKRKNPDISRAHGGQIKDVEQNDRRSVRLTNSHTIVTTVYRPPAHDLTSRLY